MKFPKPASLVGAAALMLSVTAVQAADEVVRLPFAAVVEAARASGKIDKSVSFHLAGTGGGGTALRPGVVSIKRTNAFNKSDEEACSWAAQSAVIHLFEAAKKAGASRVSNIISFHKKNEFKSTTQFECHAGALMAAVTLKADLVK